jgi:L-Ala-D/L-Glu epimerase
MKIRAISIGSVRLPFRFSFEHSLAARSYSLNIIVQVTIVDDAGETFRGWGESVPRDYVTGETVDTALAFIKDKCAQRFIGREFSTAEALIEIISEEFFNLMLESTPGGAAWCALELALLDACAQAEARPLASLFGGPQEFALQNGIQYGGVIPFSGKRAFKILLQLFKIGGFSCVKLKVSRNFDSELERLAVARKIVGKSVCLRIDPNCSWTPEETVAFADRASTLSLASIEQPVKADDWEGLRWIAERIPQEIVVDESLCTIEQAKQLASGGFCRGFNIRLSKVGGFLPALAMTKIAAFHGLSCHLGAQVGESGILSAAGRSFASVAPPFDNYEGSANFFLLKSDLTRENLTFGLNGRGKILSGHGLGIRVLPDRIENLAERRLQTVGLLSPVLEA